MCAEHVYIIFRGVVAANKLNLLSMLEKKNIHARAHACTHSPHTHTRTHARAHIHARARAHTHTSPQHTHTHTSPQHTNTHTHTHTHTHTEKKKGSIASHQRSMTYCSCTTKRVRSMFFEQQDANFPALFFWRSILFPFTPSARNNSSQRSLSIDMLLTTDVTILCGLPDFLFDTGNEANKSQTARTFLSA